ncbi:hypothetical protein [Streptomyces sp. NPDC017890]|uniref:hypothetical protein n=1 Tax=Streptomyces sp. NPDC017890 TaxID=3365015 RepID=UPI0037AA26CA
MARGGIRQTAAATGRPYRATFARQLTVRDALVVRHHVYTRTASPWPGRPPYGGRAAIPGQFAPATDLAELDVAL